MQTAQGKGPYLMRTGVIEINGHWLEVSMIRQITPPVFTFLKDSGKKCFAFHLVLVNNQTVEVIKFNSLDSINAYDFVVTAWTGVKPSDQINLNDLLGPDFFSDQK